MQPEKESGAWHAQAPRLSPKISLVALATTAATTTAEITARTTTTTTASRTFFFRAGNVDSEVTAIKRRTVQSVNGFLRLFRRAHGNEGKATRTTAHAIHHQVGLSHSAMRRKGVMQVVLSRIERQVPNEQFSTHLMFTVPRFTFALSKLFPTAGFQIITEPCSTEDLPCLGSDKLSKRRAKFTEKKIECKLFSDKFGGLDVLPFRACVQPCFIRRPH
jgi:hypothetical protein